MVGKLRHYFDARVLANDDYGICQWMLVCVYVGDMMRLSGTEELDEE